MKNELINTIEQAMAATLTIDQQRLLHQVLQESMEQVTVTPADNQHRNEDLLSAFVAAKRVEGCSDRTIRYYETTLRKVLAAIPKPIPAITTDDLRRYLDQYQQQSHAGKVTIDNIRRILSSFFAWLEDEDHIVKSPVRRIHKVKTTKVVKTIYSDENLEALRDGCRTLRDLAMIDLLASTGMRVGELVHLNRADIDFANRECIVFGKGAKERTVYFDARTKLHLRNYLNSRTDTNKALFVSLDAPHHRLNISGVEIRLRKLGRQLHLDRVHPHKFRRTMATMAIDKGMPIEQVQVLLGHSKIDTTMHYAMVNQRNVKEAHRKYLG